MKIAEAQISPSRGSGRDVAAHAARELATEHFVGILTNRWWSLADAFGVCDPDAVLAAVAAQLAIDKMLPAGDWVEIQNRVANS